MQTFRVTDDVYALAAAEPVPGKGFLPIRAYVVLDRQPVLIDMGAVRHADLFVEALEGILDPADLAWMVLTHPDLDHAGALPALLDRAPKARLVLNFISTGKLSASLVPPLPRITWVNAGESLAAGDRVYHFLRPPMYDCPSTVMVLDGRSRALFSSDAFGAFVPQDAPFLVEVAAEAALEGMSDFCRANSPWLADVSPESYARSLRAVTDLEPSWLLSGHLPAVPAADVRRVVERASLFPAEGRPPLPGQQALDAALAAMGRAA